MNGRPDPASAPNGARPEVVGIQFINGAQARAFVDVRYGPLVLCGFSVVEQGPGKFWVAPPAAQNPDRSWRRIVWIEDDALRVEIEKVVLDAYRAEVQGRAAFGGDFGGGR